MRLLLDENLSPRLVNRLELLFPGLTHVRDVGLKQADDRAIWVWAKNNDCAIVKTGAHFVSLAQRYIEDLLRRSAVRISEFRNDPNRGLLVLRFANPDNR